MTLTTTLESRLRSSVKRPRPQGPIPVSLVITELEVGGAERSLVELAIGLSRDRWSPSAIALGGPGPLVAPLEAAGIPTISLALNPRSPISGVAKVVKALRHQRPELVQSFLFHANLASRLAAPFAGRPWVLGGIRVAEREQAWHGMLERWTQWLGTGSVCVSEGVNQFSRTVSKLPASRLIVIPNGIEASRFDRAIAIPRHLLEVPNDAALLLFVGRLTGQKGVDVLLQAFRILLKSKPGAFLLVVGTGSEAERLQGLIPPADPAFGRIRWLGARDDVPSILKTADLLVLPSRWEGMPNVVLEAMAASRAVVATDVEGSRELVVPGRTGWLVPPDDPVELALVLDRAMSDPDRLARFGQVGRERVLQSYTQAAVVRAYDRLWSAILGFADE